MRELTIQETRNVNGGGLPLLAIAAGVARAAKACSSNTACKGAVASAAAAVGAAVGYENNKT